MDREQGADPADAVDEHIFPDLLHESEADTSEDQTPQADPLQKKDTQRR